MASVASDLRRVHTFYEQQASQLVAQLDQHAAERHCPRVRVGDCDKLARHSERMLKRWRRQVNLGAEMFAELQLAVTQEEAEVAHREALLGEAVGALEGARAENDAMQGLMGELSRQLSRPERQ
ncbi:hypothetical protein B484DRAFT_39041 [Ochromonadaceae sp. CCMP2298]|nr:hypothetical protein B484DRAFT_39041 [Ochromonadaceae sp. CCMP2298]|mmetsp:Transcript_29098/g.64602  ORF Transcript_29098/g.64602 Transcript_29098/m.64602 type:complete len:124 (+) Transcript_29098:101-472(+)